MINETAERETAEGDEWHAEAERVRLGKTLVGQRGGWAWRETIATLRCGCTDHAVVVVVVGACGKDDQGDRRVYHRLQPPTTASNRLQPPA